MTFERSSDLHRWARAWETAAEFLRRERAERLRTMTDEGARAAIAALFHEAAAPAAPARQTGLIEQQRLFRKLK